MSEMAHVWRTAGRNWFSSSTLEVGFGDQTQWFRLGSTPSPPLSHLAGLVLSIFLMLINCCLGIGIVCFLVILNNSTSEVLQLGKHFKYLWDIFLELSLFESCTFS